MKRWLRHFQKAQRKQSMHKMPGLSKSLPLVCPMRAVSQVPGWRLWGLGFDTFSVQWDSPVMAQIVSVGKHDKRKRLVLPDDFVAEAPYGEYIIREGKGHLSIIAIPAPKRRRSYVATSALEKKLIEAKGSKEVDCPPEFFTEPLD